MSDLAYDDDIWSTAVTGGTTSWTVEEDEARQNVPSQRRREATETNPDGWNRLHTALQGKIYPLVRLEPGWDSYNGRPVQLETAAFVLRLLGDLVDERTPIPSVVPTASGGLQVEWHTRGVDLEILVEEPYAAEYYFLDHQTGREQEASFRSDLRALNEPIELLNMRA